MKLGLPTCVAIDFETADYKADSACAVGLVRVEDGRIVRRESRLIRPPRQEFIFTYIHGITWEDVENQPSFGEVWPALSDIFAGVEFIAAHNAPFDRGVMNSCCAAAGIEPPALPFKCTVQVARKTWSIHPTRLDNVCKVLGIPLKHHDAASDAEACARILIAAGRV